MNGERTTVVIGIDNGTTGALCAVNAQCRVEAYADTPVVYDVKGKSKRARYLPSAMLDLLSILSRRFAVACVLIEKGQPMPNGGIATYLAGYCEAAWVTACCALDLPSQPIAASTWQRSQLLDVPGRDTKVRSILQASRLFPGLPLAKEPSRKNTLHGRADAALLARFGVVDMGLLRAEDKGQ